MRVMTLMADDSERGEPLKFGEHRWFSEDRLDSLLTKFRRHELTLREARELVLYLEEDLEFAEATGRKRLARRIWVLKRGVEGFIALEPRGRPV